MTWLARPRRPWPALVAALAALACRDTDLAADIAAVRDPATRTGAITRILGAYEAARRRGDAEAVAALRDAAVPALTSAFRADWSRRDPAILDALDRLDDPRSVRFLLRALEFQPGGADAALRAATLLGLRREPSAVGPLVALIERIEREPAIDPRGLLARAAVEALGRIGGPRAVSALVRRLETPPARQDPALGRAVATTLGELGAPEAAAPLVRGLFASFHGANLTAECRVALARLGRPAIAPLLAAFRGRDPVLQALADADSSGVLGAEIPARAAASLADLEAPEVVPELAARLAAGTDPPPVRAAIAEALGRLGDPAARDEMVARLAAGGPFEVQEPIVTGLGLMGDRQAIPALAKAAAEGAGLAAEAPPDVRRLYRCRAALAWSRLGGADDLATYRALAAGESDPGVQRNFRSYAVRLETAAACRDDAGCWLRRLGDADWRVAEKAALELARLPPLHPRRRDAQVALVAAIGSHSLDARRAVLLALDRLAERGCDDCVAALDRQIEHDRGDLAAASIAVEMACLRERLRQRARTGRP